MMSEHLESAVRTKVQDLDSMSACLSMHASFIRKFKEIHPLLVALGQESFASEYLAQFDQLMEVYEALGSPSCLGNDATRSYLDSVQEFSATLCERVLSLYPLVIPEGLLY